MHKCLEHSECHESINLTYHVVYLSPEVCSIIDIVQRGSWLASTPYFFCAHVAGGVGYVLR